MKNCIEIDCNRIPNVLFLGNGILRLNDDGTGWSELINRIRTTKKYVDYKCLPYAMQPEAVCRFDVEDIQQ